LLVEQQQQMDAEGVIVPPETKEGMVFRLSQIFPHKDPNVLRLALLATRFRSNSEAFDYIFEKTPTYRHPFIGFTRTNGMNTTLLCLICCQKSLKHEGF
jgi:hypothetical protein